MEASDDLPDHRDVRIGRDGHEPDEGAAERFPPELRDGLVRRDPAALERFFDVFFPRVYNFVRRMVGHEQLAEDVTQDVFVQIYRSLARYDAERDPRPWVFTIAANQVRMFWRSRRHQESQHELALDADDDLELVDPLDTPAGAASGREQRQRLRDLVEELPLSLRMTVLLRAYEGLSYDAIGAMLRVDPVAVRKRYSRAIERLRDALAPAPRRRPGAETP